MKHGAVLLITLALTLCPFQALADEFDFDSASSFQETFSNDTVRADEDTVGDDDTDSASVEEHSTAEIDVSADDPIDLDNDAIVLGEDDVSSPIACEDAIMPLLTETEESAEIIEDAVPETIERKDELLVEASVEPATEPILPECQSSEIVVLNTLESDQLLPAAPKNNPITSQVGDGELATDTQALLEPLSRKDEVGWLDRDGMRSYKDPASGNLLKAGMYDIEGETYCFDTNGTLVTGWVSCDGEIYFFDPVSGAMVKDGAALIKGLCAPLQAADGSSFSDVSGSIEHREDISWMYDKSISTGWLSSDGKRSFRPLETVKRQDMAAFLYRLAGSPSYVPTAKEASFFSDVFPETPHAEEVWWLASKGIAKGWSISGRNEFRPLDSVKRQDMAAFLYRLAGSPSFSPTNHDKSAFADVSNSTSHAKEVWWLASAGISQGWKTGSHRTFRPMSPVARADMAAFLHRMVDTGVYEPDAEHEYRFDDSGKLVTGWSDEAFYDRSNGARVDTGWVNDGSFTGYFDSERGGLLKEGAYKIASGIYLFDAKGNICKGIVKSGDYTYYARSNGRVFTSGNFVVGKTVYQANAQGHVNVSHYGQAISSASAVQKKIASIAWSEPTTPSGWCAMWVHNIFARYGWNDIYGNACDLYDNYCTSSDYSALKVGMIVAVSRHPKSSGGRVYGHIGIYVGDGLLLDSSGSVRTWQVQDWVSNYNGWVPARWGWYGNRSLA